MLLAAMLLAACNGSDDISDLPDGSGSAKADEIRLNADVWHVMEGTRATTIDGGTLTSGSFMASSYVENTNTKYINPVQVDYVTDKWVWSDGKHYWPASGDLDFFAYMPATAPSYITEEPTYSIVEDHPQAQFTCANLPMTYNAATPAAGQGSDLEEFVWGITVGQNKAEQGASGVTMKFRHPFARIKFQLAANHPEVIINSITFKNLKTGGTCTLNNTAADTYYYTTSVWSDLTPAGTGSSNLVMQLVEKDSEGKYIMTNSAGEIIVGEAAKFYSKLAATVPIGGYSGGEHEFVNLLVIPQTFAGAIEINASWNDWGDTPVEHTVTATIPSIAWQPGYSYTYTFNITPEDLVVNLTDYTEQW